MKALIGKPSTDATLLSDDLIALSDVMEQFSKTSRDASLNQWLAATAHKVKLMADRARKLGRDAAAAGGQ